MEKDKLLNIAAPYFSDGVEELLITEDGNVFYKEHAVHAYNHSRANKLEVFVVKNEDLKKKKAKTESTEEIQDTEKKTKKVKE